MWHDDDQELMLVASTHVDDLKLTGDQVWNTWLVTAIEEKVGTLTLQYAKDGFDHCGIYHKQLPDGTVTMDQNNYVKTLKPIPLPKGVNLEAEASTHYQGAYLTLLGGLGWIILTRYDVSIFVCCLQRFGKSPKMKHLLNANRLFAWLQKHEFTCHFKPLSGTLRVVCISDSASSGKTTRG